MGLKAFIVEKWLKFQLKKGKLIEIKEIYCGVERKTILIDRAKELDIIIVAGSQLAIDDFKDIDGKVKVIGFSRGFTMQLRISDTSNGVLIDDSVSKDLLEYLKSELPEIEIKGGFIY